MTERLADVTVQLQNIRQLDTVVTAMRGIAASRAQQGRSLLRGIEAYTDVIGYAIGEALSFPPRPSTIAPPPGKPKPGFILFCAEQGFAGAFSQRVLDAAGPEIKEAESLVIGTRGATIALEHGIKPCWSAAMPTHVEAIPVFANRLADALYERVAAGAMTRVDIVFARSGIGGAIAAERHSLLPVDFERFAGRIERPTPLTTLAPPLLLERLAAEYVYARLCESAMYAFEAENEARMMAMSSAKMNIARKLTALVQRERQLRQEEITTEIIELAVGAAASS